MDYYPEQWDIYMIDEDMDNIVELGCNVIRIAEFAWHIMEKTEGQYDFFVLRLCHQQGKGGGASCDTWNPDSDYCLII